MRSTEKLNNRTGRSPEKSSAEVGSPRSSLESQFDFQSTRDRKSRSSNRGASIERRSHSSTERPTREEKIYSQLERRLSLSRPSESGHEQKALSETTEST